MDMTPHFPIYMDYGATTPCDPRGVDAMIPWLREHFGNPASRTHAYGWEAEAAVEKARQEVADLIGADWLIYQDLPDLIEAVGGGKIKIEQFDCAVFDGKYVTGDVDEAYLNKIEQARNDSSKIKTQAVSAIIDLYNN